MGRRISENSWINLKCEYRDLVKRLFYRINLYVCMYYYYYTSCVVAVTPNSMALLLLQSKMGGKKTKKIKPTKPKKHVKITNLFYPLARRGGGEIRMAP